DAQTVLSRRVLAALLRGRFPDGDIRSSLPVGIRRPAPRHKYSSSKPENSEEGIRQNSGRTQRHQRGHRFLDGNGTRHWSKSKATHARNTKGKSRRNIHDKAERSRAEGGTAARETNQLAKIIRRNFQAGRMDTRV